ncbi:TPA_asm: P [Cuscuta gammacytorhabdovirus 2]|nr:TPA_asm: P [Cuscuta gammacytorhabdovirus 2]
MEGSSDKLLKAAIEASKPTENIPTPKVSMDEQARKAAEAVLQGKEYPMFKGLPELAKDSTSPLTAGLPTADSLANKIVTQAPPEIPQSLKMDKKAFKEAVLKAAVEMGVVIDTPHLEDLYASCSMATRALNQFEIKLYLKGVARANQLSMVNSLNAVVKNLENIVVKTQGVMSSSVEAVKLSNEKLVTIGAKLDNIIPSLSSFITADGARTRTELKDLVNKKLSPPSLVGESSSKAPPPITEVTEEMILSMCTALGMPDPIAKLTYSRYGKMITWELYNKVMSGEINLAGFKVLMSGWKSAH